MPSTRKASYLLFAAFVAMACFLKLGPVLLAGLFSFMILDLTHRRLATFCSPFVARWVALATFTVTAVSLAWLFIVFVRLTVQRMPVILGGVLPTVDGLASSYGIDLPFENFAELRAIVMHSVRENARTITTTSGLLTRNFFQVALGIMIAVTKFLGDPEPAQGDSLFESLRREVGDRVSLFMVSYEKVLGAQVVISLINTAVTSVFVAVVGIPYVAFLTLSCFILGVIPLVGNVASNALIIGAAFTLSPRHALLAFVFLVVSHKVQYILNGRIIGQTLKTPMWATLLGILLGEVVMGVPGIILAPAILHYAREELMALPAPRA